MPTAKQILKKKTSNDGKRNLGQILDQSLKIPFKN